MTEARAQAGWADVAGVAPVAPASPETRGQDMPAIDMALFLAFEGDLRFAQQLYDPEDRRAVFSAARCFGVAVPEDVDSRPLPFSTVADRLSTSWTTTNLFLAAEKFSGDRTRGEKAKRAGAVVAKAVTLLVDLPLSLASTAAEKMSHSRTAKGLEVTSAVVKAVTQDPFERLNEAGPRKLFQTVRRFVHGRYGVDYNNNPRLVMAWLRASVLARAAHSQYTSDATMEALVLDFWDASQGFVLREHAKDKRLAEDAGIPRLRTALRNGADARVAAIQFLDDQDEAKSAREKANRDYFKPKPSKRPTGDDLETLRMIADAYNEQLGLPYEYIAGHLSEAAGLIGDPARHYEGIYGLIDSMSVALERSRLRGGSDAGPFDTLFRKYVDSHGDSIAWFMRQNIPLITKNLASGSVLRLADHMVRNPGVWGTALAKDAVKLESALIHSAFDWFDYPYDVFKHMPEVVEAIHRAHIHGVSGLAGPPSYTPIRHWRAVALLNELPADRRKREQTESCLPPGARSQLAAARQLLGR